MAKWLLIFVLLLLVGGIAYVSISDVPVNQEQVEKTIPNNRFFQ